MQTIRRLRRPRRRINRRELSLRTRVPPRPQVHIAALLQLAGEAEGRHGAGLHAAPWIVGDDAEQHARIRHGAAHAAQGIADIPGLGSARLSSQAILAIQILCRCTALRSLKDLAEWRSEILRIASRAVVYKGAIAIIAVRRAATRRHTTQGIVAIRRRTVVYQVAGSIVGEAIDLVGGVEGLRQRARAIQPHAGAVAGQVVAVGIAGTGGFGGGGKALEAVVGIRNHARGRQRRRDGCRRRRRRIGWRGCGCNRSDASL